MAAVATKKWNGDMGVQLTFPYNFQQAYSAPFAYYPTEDNMPMDLMIGTDFQSEYHEQKRLEANKSVFDGIEAKKSAEIKLLTGPHNYHLPKPVLGQRRYANPSMGAETTSSTRRDNGELAPFKTIETVPMGQTNMMTYANASGLRGGVVLSAEGQTFYRNRLNDRVKELDAINAVSQGFAVPMGQSVATYNNEKVGPISKVDFFIHLQALMDSITEANFSSFSFDNLKDLTLLLFKFGPVANENDFNDITKSLDDMLLSMRDGFSKDPQFAFQIREGEKGIDYAQTILLFLMGMKKYVDGMFANMYMSEKDKKTLSDSLIVSLGFQKLMKSSSKSVIDTIRETNARVNQFAEDYDDEDTDGKFDKPAVAREDEEQGFQERAPFAGDGADPNRAAFGNKTGAVVYGTSGFFGEDTERDAEADFVAPLKDAGFDPNAQTGAPVNTQALKDAVAAEIETVLSTFKDEADNANKDNDEIISENYADTSMFVDEVVRNLKEKGFNPAQIAAGMSLEGTPVFEEYIADNTGDLNPPSITTYRPPTAPANQPIFEQRPAQEVPRGVQQDIFDELKIPRTRDGFRAKFDTMESIRELGGYLEPPYHPHGNTKLKTAQNRIIAILKGYNPSF